MESGSSGVRSAPVQMAAVISAYFGLASFIGSLSLVSAGFLLSSSSFHLQLKVPGNSRLGLHCFDLCHLRSCRVESPQPSVSAEPFGCVHKRSHPWKGYTYW